MLKIELLKQIASENDYLKVGVPELVEDTFGVKTYDLLVFEVTEKGAGKKTVSFYVVDEGVKGKEQAYLRTKKVVAVVEPVVEGELTEEVTK